MSSHICFSTILYIMFKFLMWAKWFLHVKSKHKYFLIRKRHLLILHRRIFTFSSLTGAQMQRRAVREAGPCYTKRFVEHVHLTQTQANRNTISNLLTLTPLQEPSNCNFILRVGLMMVGSDKAHAIVCKAYWLQKYKGRYSFYWCALKLNVNTWKYYS